MITRYDLPIPAGWFDVGLTDELAPGGHKTIRAFDEDLMLWRGADGAWHLNDVYCPHLGANIAADGKVVGNEIQCPFHGWRFDGDGVLACIPYAPEARTRARLRSFPVREHYGVVMAWFHPDGAPPGFELPAIDELDGPGYVGPLLDSHVTRTAVQELLENAVDGAHFETIHKHPGAAAFGEVTFDGPVMVSRTTQEFPSSKGPVPGTLDTHTFGLGFSVIRYRTLIEISMLQFIRPIERERAQLRFAVYYRNPHGDAKIDRIGQAFYKEVNRQVRQDIPIWDKKIYREHPTLTEGEAAIMRYRRWARQFYPSPAGRAAGRP
jgi:phenylpropionate dioxygenase-like ring-hydroxylating dioxygenase large terminal subunit